MLLLGLVPRSLVRIGLIEQVRFHSAWKLSTTDGRWAKVHRWEEFRQHEQKMWNFHDQYWWFVVIH